MPPAMRMPNRSIHCAGVAALDLWAEEAGPRQRGASWRASRSPSRCVRAPILLLCGRPAPGPGRCAAHRWGLRMLTARPSMMISPPSIRSAPKMARVRCACPRPAGQRRPRSRRHARSARRPERLRRWESSSTVSMGHGGATARYHFRSRCAAAPSLRRCRGPPSW